MGARPYRYLALYEPSPGRLIEIGSERGEGSTAYLAGYAKQHGLRFYTADIDPNVYAEAAKVTTGARLCTGLALLRRLRAPISIAYLDGADWIPEGEHLEAWIYRQRERYSELGVEMTNANCQTTHLDEARQVAAKAAPRCVVICDDTFQGARGWDGKGGQAVPHLLAQGFRIVAVDEPADKSLGGVVLKRG